MTPELEKNNLKIIRSFTEKIMHIKKVIRKYYARA